MERRERIPSNNPNAGEVAFRQAFAGQQANIWTALPAFVKSFDADAVTVEAQPTVQVQLRQPDGSWVITTISLCLDCPVVFPGGGGYMATFPLAANDEGLLVFGARCIDSWWQSGGIQTQAELRMHDLSDGFFIPTGGMSQPAVKNLINGINATGPEIRSLDGKNVIHLDANSAYISLNNGATLLKVDQQNNAVELVAGAVVIKANGADTKAEITAAGGLWVNGVEVIVP